MEGVGFGFGFGLGIGRKELLINCLVLVRWVGWVQVFNVLVLFCCLVLVRLWVGVELVGLFCRLGKRELGIDLPEYLGLMVRCLVEWSRGNVGFDRSGVLGLVGYWVYLGMGGMLEFVIHVFMVWFVCVV